MLSPRANPALEFTVAVGLGAAVGAANGVLVTRFRYQPILATLCTVFILVGLAPRERLPEDCLVLPCRVVP